MFSKGVTLKINLIAGESQLKKSRLLSRKTIVLSFSFWSPSSRFSAPGTSTLEGTVTASLRAAQWQFPSKIYSDTYLLYAGMTSAAEDLTENSAGSATGNEGAPDAKGETGRQGRRREVYLHDFAYPMENFKGFPMRVALQGTTVARMENLENGQELFSFELDPN